MIFNGTRVLHLGVKSIPMGYSGCRNEKGKFKNAGYRPGHWLTIYLVILLLTTFGVQATETGSRDPRQYFFTQSFNDLPGELQTARVQGKQGILLFFESEGCPYCLGMLKNVFSQKQVQDWYQEHFLSIAVDIHGDVEITDFDGITLPSKVFAEHRRIFMTPVLSFIDLDGNEIYRHLGMVKSPSEFLMMGEYVAGEFYFDTEYKDYVKKQGLKNALEALVTPMDKSSK